MLEWCRISTINRVREDTDETQNLYVAARSQKRVGWMLAVCNTGPLQQTANTHALNKQIKAQPSTTNQSHHQPSPAKESRAEVQPSPAKPSMRARNTKHTRPKTQSIRLAYHFNSFRVGCVHTSCRALPLRLTVCLYLNSCPQPSLHKLVSYNARKRLEEILG